MSWLFGGRKGHDPNAAAPARQPPAGGVPPGVGMQQDVRHQVQDAGAGGYHPAAGGYQPVPQPAPRVQHQIPQHQIPQQHVPQQQHQQQHHHHHQTPPQPSHLGTPPTFQRHKSDGATLRVGALKYPALDMIEVSVKADASIPEDVKAAMKMVQFDIAGLQKAYARPDLTVENTIMHEAEESKVRKDDEERERLARVRVHQEQQEKKAQVEARAKEDMARRAAEEADALARRVSDMGGDSGTAGDKTVAGAEIPPGGGREGGAGGGTVPAKPADIPVFDFTGAWTLNCKP